MSAEENILRAREAEAILANPVFIEARNLLVESTFRTFCSSDMGDADGREACYMMRLAISKLDSQLRSFVDSGKLEVATALEAQQAEQAE